MFSTCTLSPSLWPWPTADNYEAIAINNYSRNYYHGHVQTHTGHYLPAVSQTHRNDPCVLSHHVLCTPLPCTSIHSMWIERAQTIKMLSDAQYFLMKRQTQWSQYVHPKKLTARDWSSDTSCNSVVRTHSTRCSIEVLPCPWELARGISLQPSEWEGPAGGVGPGAVLAACGSRMRINNNYGQSALYTHMQENSMFKGGQWWFTGLSYLQNCLAELPE